MKQLITILKNASSNWINIIISIIIGFFLSPFIIHKLGDVNYGMWVLVGSLINYYGLLDLGIGSAVVRYVSKYHGSDDHQSLNETINTCFFLFLGIGIICLVISFALAFAAPHLFKVSRSISYLILIMGLGVAITFPAKVFDAAITALERFDTRNNIDIAVTVIKVILIVFFLSRGYTLIALGLITLGEIITSTILYVRYSFKYLPNLKIRFSLVRKDRLGSIFNYSMFSFLSRLGDYIKIYTDTLVIGWFLPISNITYYAIGASLIDYFRKFIWAICSTTTPVFSKYESKNETEKIQNLLIKGTKYLTLLSTFIGSLLILYGKAFITLWMGKKYESSYFVLLILVVPYIVAFSQGLSNTVLYGIGKHKVLSYITIIEAMVNFTLSIILVKKYGIYGVVIGTALPMFIVKTIVQPYYVCRILNIPLQEYFYKALLFPVITCLLYISFMKYVVTMFPPASYSELIFAGALSFVVFSTIAVFFCIEDDERKMWRNLIPVMQSKI